MELVFQGGRFGLGAKLEVLMDYIQLEACGSTKQ